jgi:signal transduction histidine kinase
MLVIVSWSTRHAMPELLSNTLYLLMYGFALSGVALYLPWRAWWLGTTPRVLIDSALVGAAALVLLRSVLPRIVRSWSPEHSSTLLFPAFNLAALFAVATVSLRYGRRGGPLLAFSLLSLFCLFCGDTLATALNLFPGLQRPGYIVAPLYTLHYVLLAWGAYRSVWHPPQALDAPAMVMPLTHWALWSLLPRVLLFASLIISSILAPVPLTPLLVLLALAGFREVVAAFDQRRVQRALYSAQEKLRGFVTQAEDLAVEQERVRVAREIHDGLGHHLNNAKLHLGVATRYFDADHTTSLDSLNTAKSEIGTAQRELRRAIEALMGNEFADPLEELLQEPVRDCKLAGINASLQIVGTPRPLPEQVKHALYRIGQEAFNNIRQHSHAKQATLEIDYQEHSIRIIIEDDGVGIPNTTEHRRGRGLENLQERAALLGGTSAIEPRPGQGVRVVVEVPI